MRVVALILQEVSGLTLISFDNLIQLREKDYTDYYKGLSDKEVEALEQIRKHNVMRLLDLQFSLAYFMKLSKSDTDNMTLTELEVWVELLKDRDKEKNKVQGGTQ